MILNNLIQLKDGIDNQLNLRVLECSLQNNYVFFYVMIIVVISKAHYL